MEEAGQRSGGVNLGVRRQRDCDDIGSAHIVCAVRWGVAGLGVDQAALHGLLKKVRDLGMPLLSVIHV